MHCGHTTAIWLLDFYRKKAKVNLSLGHVTQTFMQNVGTHTTSHMQAGRGIAWSALCTALHWRAKKAVVH